jgi:pimeloyl-ACP methyl ester carboxylesterase
MVAIILAVGPFALMAGGLAFWITVFTGTTDESNQRSVLFVYSISALRLSALVPLCLPFARIMLDVAGDIIFHLQPADARLSSRPFTLPRIKNLLETLRRDRPDNHIMVLAHSQGSVIAWTVLREHPDAADSFVTVGSPLTTLYTHLLGGEFGEDVPAPLVRWKNLYCNGDYIGGEIAKGPKNDSLGPGGHTGYWRDPRLIRHL